MARSPLLLWIVGGFALVLGLFRAPGFERQAGARAPRPADAWCTGGFSPRGVFPAVDAEWLPANSEFVGSWRADDWQGEAATPWLPVPARRVRVWVAGYPQREGCFLRVEFRGAGGAVSTVACDLADPRETWAPWDFAAPARATELRIVAQDHAAGPTGWLAFSKPAPRPAKWGGVVFMAAQVLTTFALTLVLLWGPGLLWGPRETSETARAIGLLGFGPLLLAVGGVLAWLGGGMVAPKVLGFGFVAGEWIALGVALWRRRGVLPIGRRHAQAIAVSALCALAAIARAADSDGPEGELYGGLIARTLAVGDRSDSRISYYIPQIVQQHVAPASVEAERYFTPWNFFSRGPLAGLAATPIVFATGGEPLGPEPWPAEATTFHRWQRFDPTGFAAYRIVLMTLASMVIVALFAALAPVVGETWALLGGGLLALCPFGLHEVMFTWPKLAATTWVLVSFRLSHERRPLGAGVALAVGFLFHPLAALWAPWLAWWSAGRSAQSTRGWASAAARYTAGFGVVALPWIALGSLPPQLAESVHAGQAGFFAFFKLAAYAPATWETWWHARATNFANTFVPLWLHAFQADNAGLSSIHAPSGAAVRFAFGWWNTLPLGLGLGVWALALIALCRAGRRLAGGLLCLVIGPALWLTAYWGAFVTGLMRECGHPLLAAVIGVFVVALAKNAGRLARLVAHPLFPWLQLPETLAMLWLTTCLNPHQPGVEGRALNPLFLALNLAALAAAAWILARVRREWRAPARDQLGGATSSPAG